MESYDIHRILYTFDCILYNTIESIKFKHLQTITQLNKYVI